MVSDIATEFSVSLYDRDNYFVRHDKYVYLTYASARNRREELRAEMTQVDLDEGFYWRVERKYIKRSRPGVVG